jgi:energy-coupling factor transporter transmembrane protein EcfT
MNQMKTIIGLAIMLFISTHAFSQTEPKRDIHEQPGSRNIAADSRDTRSYVVTEHHTTTRHYNWKKKPYYAYKRKSCSTSTYHH